LQQEADLMDVDLLQPAILLVPAVSVVILLAAIGLSARGSDDHRGHRRRWATVGFAAVVLVGWVVFFLYIYSQAATT
jgi:uncharacterized membrane protein YozB (DUF420 family)